jgi:hydrogenase maturation protein HypF
VWLVNERGEKVAEREEALEEVAEWIKEGKIVAVKGLGGFHLVCDACNGEALRELRRRKRREEKPFAVMFKDLEQVKEFAEVSPLEEVALKSVEAPIVILKSRGKLPQEVSPGLSTVGAFLPYTPLHHILLAKLERPIVATSCNLSEQPIMKDNEEVLGEVGKLVDGALLHNREIARRCDDSVVRIIGERIVPIRRSRGFAPLPVLLPFRLKRKVLALGPHMKNTVALARGREVYLSQHVGDTDNYLAEEFLKETVEDLTRLLEIEPDVVVADYHPGYFTTKWGREVFGDRLIQVYHHHAHAISVMAENGVEPKEEVLALAFDGTGYGEDGTIWGGEFLRATYTEFERVGHLLQFSLPGGESAVKEPYRVAVSLLMEAGIEPEEVLKVEPQKLKLIKEALKRGINSPRTSSMGRLFDGIGAILGIKEVVSYQAQGAILVEEEALKWKGDFKPLPVAVEKGVVDWREMVKEVVKRLRDGAPKAQIARAFHRWVVESSLKVAEEAKIEKVALSGGVFQNKLLTEELSEELRRRGFKVLTHQIVPPNDGGLSLGQAVYGGLIEKGG